jgi:serine/threonine protein kinase
MTTWFDQPLRIGDTICGKWNGNSYTLVKLLGSGANGQVYQVKKGFNSFALKIGFDTVDHQSEINALRQLSKDTLTYQGFIIEFDDFEKNGKEFPFFVMKYIEGVSLNHFVAKHGFDWMALLGQNILGRLTELHRNGYIFGDLKMENMLVTGYGDVELIDFGGVTAKGRSVKQFTEMYDRGYWGAGDRVADEGYDLYAFAILMLMVFDERKQFPQQATLLPQNRSARLLLDMIDESPQFKPIAVFLQKALLGKLTSSKEAYQLWRKLALVGQEGRARQAKSKKQTSILAVCLAGSLLFCGAAFIYLWSG